VSRHGYRTHDNGEIGGQSHGDQSLRHVAQEGRLIEAVQAHGPLDDLTITAELQPAVLRARDRCTQGRLEARTAD
jgi:hypothetical protein